MSLPQQESVPALKISFSMSCILSWLNILLPLDEPSSTLKVIFVLAPSLLSLLHNMSEEETQEVENPVFEI